MKKTNKADQVVRKSMVGNDLDFASREAYNLLRTNISFAFPDVDHGRVIGVCSSCPQEGKSTTSINLAYSLADSGNKVLLIDGDMRRPTIADVLSISSEPGLSDVLSGKQENNIVEGVMHENLSVLASGHIPPNPSELISSNRMGALLESCSKTYDYVIVDLPPVLSVSDPIAVSKYLDGMIVVVRHGKTKRRDLMETIRQLDYAKVKVLGFVYNKMGVKNRKYHSYTRNKYRYAEYKG